MLFAHFVHFKANLHLWLVSPLTATAGVHNQFTPISSKLADEPITIHCIFTLS